MINRNGFTMKEMESQASFYWERDNTTHFILRGKDMIFYVKGTWEGYEWDDEEKLIPDKVKKSIDKLVKKQYLHHGKQYKLPGCKEWTLEEYIDDSTF